jgi:hypothetical protein
VRFAGGTRYRLEEEIYQKRALVLNADTGERLAAGYLVDAAWVFAGVCRWQ